MPRPKSYLSITEAGVERRPFSGLTLDDLPPLIGDRTGKCHLALTRCYFASPVIVIANDDDYDSTDWPVSAVINDHPFRGALVILAERSVDPAAPPLAGDTFLDGLTARECKEVTLAIQPPEGASLRYRL
jgi:hypothetical protein